MYINLITLLCLEHCMIYNSTMTTAVTEVCDFILLCLIFRSTATKEKCPYLWRRKNNVLYMPIGKPRGITEGEEKTKNINILYIFCSSTNDTLQCQHRSTFPLRHGLLKPCIYYECRVTFTRLRIMHSYKNNKPVITSHISCKL